MGISLGRIVQVSTMRTFIIACLAIVGAVAEPESDAYTIGQVYSGYAPGVVTGVDYGNGLVSGYGAIGNRGYAGHIGYSGLGGYSGYGHGYAGNLGYSGFGSHYIGKGSADADSDSYTIDQVAHGLPQANAYATGHPHNAGVVTGVDYGYGRVAGYGAIGNRGYAGYAGNLGYSGFGSHYIGKRSADADSDSYTVGQVALGLPQANAYATGHPHNPGYVRGISYGNYGGYGGYSGNIGYAGHGIGYAGHGYGYAGHGYAGSLGYSYGK